MKNKSVIFWKILMVVFLVIAGYLIDTGNRYSFPAVIVMVIVTLVLDHFNKKKSGSLK
ncbi:hypothetical protein [Companilactobacillus hulinensis]|uniref:hypothetical protein n=1 Tax=Companilactobacillus hulinensis TaxID=2486007 RepID=UPI0013DE68F7|nr:hypothetical protein [Companilactobacillus hulinensis]